MHVRDTFGLLRGLGNLGFGASQIQNRAEHGRNALLGRTAQTREDQRRQGQARADQGRSGQTTADERRSGQTRAVPAKRETRPFSVIQKWVCVFFVLVMLRHANSRCAVMSLVFLTIFNVFLSI